MIPWDNEATLDSSSNRFPPDELAQRLDRAQHSSLFVFMDRLNCPVEVF